METLFMIRKHLKFKGAMLGSELADLEIQKGATRSRVEGMSEQTFHLGETKFVSVCKDAMIGSVAP